MKTKIKQYCYLVIGLLLVALAFNLFLSPYNLAAGGVSGLAIIIHKVLGINESVFIFITNLFLIIISLRFLGLEKTKNTILGSFLFPIFTAFTENISNYIVLDIDPLLVAILGGVVSGFGYGLIFQNNFTTGGTDILNQIAEKYLKIPMSKSMMFIDGTIVLAGFFIFGINNIYALITLYLISDLSNKTQLNINKNKVLYITSTKIKEIKDYLIKSGYDITFLDYTGGYTKKKGKIIMVSIPEKDYFKIKEAILIMDEKAFIIVTKAYELENANVTLRKECKIN